MFLADLKMKIYYRNIKKAPKKVIATEKKYIFFKQVWLGAFSLLKCTGTVLFEVNFLRMSPNEFVQINAAY